MLQSPQEECAPECCRTICSPSKSLAQNNLSNDKSFTACARSRGLLILSHQLDRSPIASAEFYRAAAYNMQGMLASVYQPIHFHSIHERHLGKILRECDICDLVQDLCDKSLEVKLCAAQMQQDCPPHLYWDVDEQTCLPTVQLLGHRAVSACHAA